MVHRSLLAILAILQRQQVSPDRQEVSFVDLQGVSPDRQEVSFVDLQGVSPVDLQGVSLVSPFRTTHLTKQLGQATGCGGYTRARRDEEVEVRMEMEVRLRWVV